MKGFKSIEDCQLFMQYYMLSLRSILEALDKMESFELGPLVNFENNSYRLSEELEISFFTIYGILKTGLVQRLGEQESWDFVDNEGREISGCGYRKHRLSEEGRLFLEVLKSKDTDVVLYEDEGVSQDPKLLMSSLEKRGIHTDGIILQSKSTIDYLDLLGVVGRVRDFGKKLEEYRERIEIEENLTQKQIQERVEHHLKIVVKYVNGTFKAARESIPLSLNTSDSE